MKLKEVGKALHWSNGSDATSSEKTAVHINNTKTKKVDSEFYLAVSSW